MSRFSWRSVLLALVLLGLAWSPGQAGETSAPGRRSITDMCGRQVSVPVHITRIVTAEGTPSVNSTLLALGKGGLIVNGLPPAMHGSHWKYQLLFAPQLADQPAVSAHGASWVPNLEVLQSVPHDVALVVTPAMAQLLTERGFTAVCLGWGNPVTMLGSIRLLGDILECPERSQAFLDYYQRVIDRVAKRVADLPPDKRRTVLYLRTEGPTASTTIRDLVAHAGGRYAAPPDVPLPELHPNAERMLGWDPEVLLVMAPAGVRQVLDDPRLSTLRAVKNKQVYAVPSGALAWSHPSPERALGILWMAKCFYPDRFADVDMMQEAHAFYLRFFDKDLTREQLADIMHIN